MRQGSQMKQKVSAALLAAGALALAGCAQAVPGGPVAPGGDGRSAGFAAVRASYTRTVAARSAHVRVTETVSGIAQLGSYSVHADGRLDLAHDAAQFSLTAPVLGTSQVRVLGSTLYTRLPDAVVAVLRTRPWIKVDLTRQPTLGAGFGGGLTGALPLLAQVSSSVTEVASPVLDGVPTTEYLARVERSKVLAKAGLATALASRATGSASVPVRVWIDAQGRTRQLSLSMSIGAVASTGSTAGQPAVHLDLTETLSDYGTPVTVTAPPASQVGSLSDLTGLAASGLTGTGA